MPQFDVYRNKNPATRSAYPLLVDVQADLLDDLQTRVVIPLTHAEELLRRPLTTLTPIVTIEGEKYLVVTPEIAGIGKSHLGACVGAIPQERDKIVAALDLLITGS